MKTFAIKFREQDGYDPGHEDRGRILDSGHVEVWCPWDDRWIPFYTMDLLRSTPSYSEEHAEFIFEEDGPDPAPSLEAAAAKPRAYKRTDDA